jgi:Transposase domain (DUF772)
MPDASRPGLLWGAVLVFAVGATAAMYEWLRAKRRTPSVWTWVGVGYGVRAALGYAIGERSSRRLERRCVEDVAMRVICANQAPDHTTIARFRQRHETASSWSVASPVVVKPASQAFLSYVALKTRRRTLTYP